MNGEGGSAGTQHQSLLPRHLRSGRAEQVGKAVVVGVVAQEGPVRTAEDGIHAADPPGLGGQLITVGDHRFFIGNGHIQPAKLPRPEEGPQFLRRQLDQTVFVAGQLAVDGGGKAVAQLFPDEAVISPLRHGQQMTSL